MTVFEIGLPSLVGIAGLIKVSSDLWPFLNAVLSKW